MARKGEPPVVRTCTPRGTRRAGASGGHAPPLLGPRRGPNYGAAWPSSKFSESRKKRVVLPADAGRAEQANDERAGLVQAAGTRETDADVARLQAEQMIGAAGAPSRVTAERRLKDNGLTAARRPLPPPPDSDIASIVFGSDHGPHADGAAGSGQMAQQSTLGTRPLQEGSRMDMSRRSTNHLTVEQLYGSEMSGVPPCDPRDFEAAHGISSRAISENLATSLDITRRSLGVRHRSHTDPRDVAGTPHTMSRAAHAVRPPLLHSTALTDIHTHVAGRRGRRGRLCWLFAYAQPRRVGRHHPAAQEGGCPVRGAEWQCGVARWRGWWRG